MSLPPIIPDDLALPITCPWCGRVNNRHHGIDRAAEVKPGDVGICWGCMKTMIFESQTRVRRPTPEEQAVIDARPDMALARAARRESYIPDEAVALTRGILGGDDDPS